MFALWKGLKTTLHFEDHIEEHSIGETFAPLTHTAPGSSTVDPACNVSITIRCIQQLYNVGGYVPKATKKNKIGITGYLEQYANIQDLQSFYADQRPDALNSTFKFVSVKGKTILPPSVN
jgi:tripeptidyl-peptidase-1